MNQPDNRIKVTSRTISTEPGNGGGRGGSGGGGAPFTGAGGSGAF